MWEKMKNKESDRIVENCEKLYLSTFSIAPQKQTSLANSKTHIIAELMALLMSTLTYSYILVACLMAKILKIQK